MVLFSCRSRKAGKQRNEGEHLKDLKIRAKLLLMVPASSEHPELTLAEAIRIIQKSKPKVSLTLSDECVSLTRKYSTEDDLISVTYDKITQAKTTKEKKRVISITYVCPDGHLMCCCLKLDKRQQLLKRKCNITGASVEEFINNKCQFVPHKGNSSTRLENDNIDSPTENALRDNQTKTDCKKNGEKITPQRKHVPAFNKSLLNSPEKNLQCHSAVMPSIFTAFVDYETYNLSRIISCARQTSRFIPLFATSENLKLATQNQIDHLDAHEVDYTEEDMEVAMIMMNCTHDVISQY